METESQTQSSKEKSSWSTFRNAYFRNRNLKSFWKKLNKEKIPSDFVSTMNSFVNSQSYNWSSKFWRHWTINHLKIINSKELNDFENIISQEYFTFTYLNELIIKDACENIKKKILNVKTNLFKKQDDFTFVESINHNLIILLLLENIKEKDVFKYFKKIHERKKNNKNNKPFLTIDNLDITQDDLNSLFEYEQIEKLIQKTKKEKNTFIEIGAGSGRTAATFLSINENAKYVIADIPPAINISLKNIKSLFPEKKIKHCFEINDSQKLLDELKLNDVLFIFPHQIELFPKKTFDLAIAIDCLHEMEKNIVQKYMNSFENVSKGLYFKVWENADLPYSFYKKYSVHNKEDYFIKNNWKELLKERCLFPSNFYHMGYQFWEKLTKFFLVFLLIFYK